MDNWLFGDTAAKKIITLYDAFVKNRVETAESLLGPKFISKFHPILSDSTVYKSIDIDRITELQNIEGNINLSKAAQKIRKDTYNNLTFLDWFADNTNGVSIDLNILEHEPNAYLEVEEALKLITQSNPWMGSLFDYIISELCFVIKNNARRFEGGSSDYRLLGTIFCSLKQKPNNILDLSVCLAHELGHQVLMIYQTGQDPISLESHDTYVYSGIRKTERPVYGSFHAVVALGYMVQFCKNISLNSDVGEELRRLAKDYAFTFKKDLTSGLLALSETKLNTIGKIITKELIAIAK